jgi:glycosyltransferase involved in cell wall biosynthesis
VRILISVPDLAAESGGPSLSAVRTAQQLSRLGAACAIAFGADERPLVADTEVRQYPLPRSGGRLPLTFWRHLNGLGGAIADFMPDVVYDFGVWLPENIASHVAARRSGTRWICSPRGMLEPWSISNKALKKRVAWLTYQKRFLRRADALVGTSREECDNLRRLLPDSSVWLIPNGVDLPAEVTRPESELRQALFLSRIDHKKQPDLLIRAWATLRPNGWRLVIAGPSEPTYRQYLQQLIDALGLRANIELREAVYGAQKQALLANSHLFVLPTMSENFGIAIAEALAYGLPVITTTGTPWSDIQRVDCGWHVEPNESAIVKALAAACALPASHLAIMGQRGRALAQQYSWDRSASALLERCLAMLTDSSAPT